MIKWLIPRPALLTIVAAAISSEGAVAALAEGASSTVLEEVLVSARKREESLQETPVAVSAFNAAELEARNVVTVSELSRFAPNVQFDSSASESGGGGSNQIAIRGIGQTDYVLTVEPGVAVYMDGVYIGKSMGSLIDNVDLEQVEVLRGPQGTLFGKNTIGGAISVISKRPSAEPEFSAEITGGSYDRIDAKISASGPLHDRVRARVSAASQTRDGYVDRIGTGQTEGSKEALFGRFVAEVDVTDNFMATIGFDITDTNEEQAGRVLLRADENGFFSSLHNTFDFPACTPGVDPARFTNPDCFNSQWVTKLDDLRNTSRGPNRSDSKVWGTNLTLDWQLGDYSIKSITAYRNVEVDIGQDLAPNPIVYFDWVFQDIELDAISQELQFSGNAFDDRLTYLLGFFYLNEEGTQVFPVRFDPFSLTSGGSIDNTSTAVFAQGTYDITDRLALTLGGRFTHEETRFRPEQSINEIRNPVITAIIPTVVPGTPILPRVFVESTEDNFSPAVTVSYDLTDDILTYFTYSQGFKAGGFTMRAFPPVIPGVTTPFTDPNDIIPAFGPEEVEMYEVGVKSELFDRRMRLNLAGFVTNYDQLQLLALTGVGGLVPVIFNAGDARLWGVEAEVDVIVTEWLRMDGSVGWLDHEYLTVDPNTAGVTIDNELVNAPEWSTHFGATADLMQNDYGHVFLRADWSYKSSQFKDPSNDPLLLQDGYHIVNASLSWESINQQWLATVGVTNATDEIYIVSGIDNDGTGITAANPSRPQEWFVKLKYSF